MTALLLAVGVLLSACGQKEAAASMHLVKAEGKVEVSDKEGKDIGVVERLGLYSGYQVGTQNASYAWIDLDEVKLAKMDEESEIEIQKEGKELTASVKSGSLFFHVEEPLAEDETFDIRYSTMVVGIRGTCGWVEVRDEEHMLVYILEGTVEGSVTALEGGETKTEPVTAGERAELFASDGQAGIRVEKFKESDIPAFVLEELLGDEALNHKVSEASGLAVGEGTSEEEDPEDGSLEDDGKDGEEEPQILTVSQTGLSYITSGGGVILTVKDGLCGAINRQGESIVPHQYPYYYCEPSEEGIFALGDDEQCTFFDREGRELVTLPGSYGISIELGEGKITYAYTREDGSDEIGCYDLESGAYLVQIPVEELMPDGGVSNVSPVQDGVFYCSLETEGLFLVQMDGSMVRIDDAREAMWKDAGWSSHTYESVPLDPAESGVQIAGVGSGGGMPRYWAWAVKDGYMPSLSIELGVGIALFDCQTQQYFEIPMDTEEAEQIFGVNPQMAFSGLSIQIPEYYSGGYWYGSRGMQMVVNIAYQEEIDRCFLLDFSKAELNEYREVTNLAEVVLAEHETITMTDEGWYLASEGEEYFYLDEQGRRMEMPKAQDCSGYWDGYAMMIDGDGMAYVIDMDFQKVSEGYPADAVAQTGDMFVIYHGEEETALFMK